MTPRQRSLMLVRARLDPRDPSHSASVEVQAHLNAIRSYLETWVLPHIDYAAGQPEQYSGEHYGLRADSASRLKKV
jgi:hypothetical protein